jgi:bacillithiol biosynthesis cysteine-adding enzyme BshC
MKLNLDYNILPGQSRFFLDYISGKGEASKFFSYQSCDVQTALKRGHKSHRRSEISKTITDYNLFLNSPQQAIENARRMSDEKVFTVITGQQAGFLGGPLYTAYKIATAINISEKFNRDFPDFHFVPLFWLASEDHDFEEINHVNFIKDGETGKIKFDWHNKGRSVYDIPLSEEIFDVTETYFQSLPLSPHREMIKNLFLPSHDKKYSTWTAKFWSKLFGRYGLVVIEPQILRHAAGELFTKILKSHLEVNKILETANSELYSCGYSPAIDSGNIGLFTYDEHFNRIKVKNPEFYIKAAEGEKFSPDALLRPIVADYLLPNIASIVGSGELSYQGQIKHIYEYFNIDQAVIIPRQSYTFVSDKDLDCMKKYNINPDEIFRVNLEYFFEKLKPEQETSLFSGVKEKIKTEIEKLSSHLNQIEPNLVKTNEQTLNTTLNALNKLEDKTIKAVLSRQGYSRKHLRELGNSLFPFGKLQERVFPVTHFLNYYGIENFIEILLNNKDVMNFTHMFICEG